MKKLIVYYPGVWAERLLTVERFREVCYFVTDDVIVNRYAPLGSEYGKEVYSAGVLAKENKEDILILVSDNTKYATAKEVLEWMGFVENLHFFNGWKLNLRFYKQIASDSSWMSYEEKNDESISDCSFEQRTKLMLKMIPGDVHSVMDLGCGVSFLKTVLPSSIQYYGLDICERKHTSFVCDLNREFLPGVYVDMYYMAGLVYYIIDIDRLFSQMTKAKYILFDYGGTERYLRLDGVPGDPLIGARNNFYSLEELFNILHRHGFVLENAFWDTEKGKIGWHIYLFKNSAYSVEKEKEEKQTEMDEKP